MSNVANTLCAMHKRFATGTYALWYPVVDRRRNQALERALQTSVLKIYSYLNWVLPADSDEYRYDGECLIIINPP